MMRISANGWLVINLVMMGTYVNVGLNDGPLYISGPVLVLVIISALALLKADERERRK